MEKEKVQFQIQISTEIMDALKAAAGKMGITPNVLARMILHEHFRQPDEEAKGGETTQINLSDEFLQRAKEHLKETGRRMMPIEAFIEEAVDLCIESDPWGLGDICVHNNECMHFKTVEDWKKEQLGGGL